LSLPILDKLSLSTCAKDLSIPIFILLFSLATGILLSPRKSFLVGAVLSFLNIIYNTFMILSFFEIIHFKYIAVLVFFFLYIPKSICMIYGCMISISISTIYIFAFSSPGLLRNKAGQTD
jgi:hypothetical protein